MGYVVRHFAFGFLCDLQDIEKECCDGSDERPGVCPNDCKKIGEEYRQKRDAELKTRKTVRHPAHALDFHLFTL
jgi:hypothetical protein